MATEDSNLDLILSDLGEYGYAQKKYSAILGILSAYSAIHTLQYSFVGFEIDFECHSSHESEALHNKCPGGRADQCERIVFSDSTLNESSIVSEWSLVCDRSWQGPFTMSHYCSEPVKGCMKSVVFRCSLG